MSRNSWLALSALALTSCAALAKMRRVPEAHGPNPSRDGAEVWYRTTADIDINCSKTSVERVHRLRNEQGQLCYQIIDYGYTRHAPQWPEVRLRNVKGQFLTIPLKQAAGPDDLGRCEKLPDSRFARYQYEGCAPLDSFIDASTLEVTTVVKSGDVDFDLFRWRFEG